MSGTRYVGRGRILAAALALGSVGLLAGCASAPALVTYGLAAPVERVSAPMRLPGLVLIVEPSAIELYSTERVVVREPDGALSYLPGVQYADQLPALVQTRLVETFENASRLGGVARPGDRVTPDWQLNSSIRTFWVDVETNLAVVEIAVRAVSEANGRVGAARVFTARVPVAAIEGRAAMLGLEAALAEVMLDIVRFAGTGGGNA
ncbi:ABC-type transport auxiliary lipoprotein family protein [Salinarimonas rosea]|uniref:ABC-type transport auxiliary lipoprotein family protein n=1 Tax=Salinarimonas rosea TaxID=552063 RepID=UPI00048D07A8|nr:ABC-type transport auxiliary lipoprotein family protein [Salinarimonas rosea]